MDINESTVLWDVINYAIIMKNGVFWVVKPGV
jgi:hypothetical protein